MRYSIRTLLKTPGLTLIAILSLAISISANSAMFSLTNALILRSLPVRDPAALVSIALVNRDVRTGLTVGMIRQLRHDQRVFSEIFAADGGGLTNFETSKGAWAGGLELVDGDYFRALGVQPAVGRLIGPEDAALGNLHPAPVAVLGYSCWQARFHADPHIIGQQIRVEGLLLTIIGVAPSGFAGLTIDAGFDAAVPFHYTGAQSEPNEDWVPAAYARLKPGVTLEQARSQLEAIWPAIRAANVPETWQGDRRASYFTFRISVKSAAKGTSWLRERFTRPLMVLTGLVGLMLIVACANLATIMLARAAARARESGICLALGASTSRLIRHGLAESLLLSAAGAALGFAAAGPITRLMLEFIWSGYVPYAGDVSPDYNVAAFTAGLAVIAALLFGTGPSWRASRVDPLSALQSSARVLGTRVGRSGRILIAAQVALSLVLVVGAALFVTSLRNLRNADAGFRRDHILTAQLFPRPGGYRGVSQAAYYHEMERRLQQLPGVRAVSFSNLAPLMMYEYKERATPKSGDGESIQAVTDLVGPGFFSLMGMRVLAGREFGWRDDTSAPHVAIVSQSFARRVFPGMNAIGQHISLGSSPAHQDLEIVGVVNSASLWLIRTHEPVAVYTPVIQEQEPAEPNLDVLTASEPASFADSLRRVVESMGHERVLRTQTLEARTDWLLTNDRLIALLSASFGGIVLFLAAIGLYGLMSFAVSRRTAEIGVRMAVGASRSSVLGLVLREVIVLVTTGMAAGIPLALVGSRLIASMLYGVSPADPAILAGSAAILLGIGIIAGYVPARRASRLDPVTALRTE